MVRVFKNSHTWLGSVVRKGNKKNTLHPARVDDTDADALGTSRALIYRVVKSRQIEYRISFPSCSTTLVVDIGNIGEEACQQITQFSMQSCRPSRLAWLYLSLLNRSAKGQAGSRRAGRRQAGARQSASAGGRRRRQAQGIHDKVGVNILPEQTGRLCTYLVQHVFAGV